MSARAIQAFIPRGAGGGGGKGGGKGGGGGSASIAADTLASRAYANVVLAVAEGEVQGLANGLQDVYLDGTAVENPDGSYNFSGLSFYFTPGTQNQNYVPGFADVENETSVALEVLNSAPLVRSIADANANAVRVTVNLPALYYTNLGNGDVSGSSVDIAIDVQTNGGGYVQRVYDTISGKASQNYERAYRISLAGSGPWDIRVRRVTPDSTTGNPVNAIYWTSYTEIIDAKLSYPNTACAYLTVDSGQFQSIPTVALNLQGMRIQVPSNYDPVARTYTGAWDGTFKIAYSNNPAWCFYDLITAERYGLGNFVAASQIDKWALYTIGQYCDELVPDGNGGQEPRFTLNCYIQNYADAFKVVQDLASVFRGMPFWATGAVTAVQDAPANAVALFTAANVIDGMFTYTGSSLKSRHTVALVTWYDMTNQAQPTVEYVSISDDDIAKYGEVITQVTAMGCTSRGQAHRVGRWILYSEKYEGETIAFKTGLDAAEVRPGNIIKISDPVRAGQRLGGRISAATANTVTIDSPLIDQNGNPVNAAGATLSVIAMDGSVQTSTPSSVISGYLIEDFSRPSIGTYFDATGTMQIAQPNQPRIDYSTGTPELLIENAATNLCAYSSFSGGTIGQIGNGGILPTGWYVNVGGLTGEIVGLPVINGIQCVSLRFYGTSQSDACSSLCLQNQMPVDTQTPYTDSFYISLSGGTTNNVTCVLWGNETDIPENANINDQQPSINARLTNKITRLTNQFPTDASQYKGDAVTKQLGLVWYYSAGNPVDITLTIGAPQTEAGTQATSFIPTNGAPVTRAADVATYSVKPGAETLVLENAFVVLPKNPALWILETAEIEAQLFRIIQITRSERAEFTITALTYNPSKYGYVEDNLTLEAQAITDLSQPPAPPTSLVCTESLYKFQSTIFSMAALSWPAVANVNGYVVGWQRNNGNWQFVNVAGAGFELSKTDPGDYIFQVWSVGANGKKSSICTTLTQTLYGKYLPPSNVQGLSYSWDYNNGLVLNWEPAPDVDLASYEVRQGTNWATGTVLGQAKTTTFNVGSVTSGQIFWAAVLDTQGVYSAQPASVTPVVPQAAAPVVTAQFVGENGVITWTAPQSVLAVDHYLVSIDGGNTVLSTIKGTRYSAKALWVGTQNFSIAAVDINGTVGGWGGASLTVSLPSITSVTDQVIDNDVMLRWQVAQGTLPIDHYVVLKGAVLAQAVALGQTLGTFDTVFETAQGFQTYWVVPVDSAANVGTAGAITVYVSPPPDYELQYNLNSAWGGTKTNITADTNGMMLAPVDTTTSYGAHFASNNWQSPQDQINAGLPLFIEPVPLSASYVEFIDYGQILPASNILVTLSAVTIIGTPAFTIDIAVSADNQTWQSYSNTSSVYVSNFRYAKITLNITGTSGQDILQLNNLNIKYQVKQKTDGGSVNCLASDANGTPVEFNIPFLEVKSITLTPNATIACQAVYDFTPGPAPTGFSILLFDINGNRISGSVSWAARGI